MKKSSGFTLIELMIVLLIIATLSSLVAPSIASAFRRGGLSATGNQLCEMLNFSYMSAVTQQRPVVVNIDAGRGRCWVSVSRPALPWLKQEREGEGRPLAVMELPKGTEVDVRRGEDSWVDSGTSRDWETVTFRSDGMSEDLFIELSSPKGEHFEIEILGVTGEVRGKEVAS